MPLAPKRGSATPEQMEKYLESRRRRIESGERYYAQLANNPPKKKKKKGFFKQAVQLPFKAVREVTKPIVKNLPKGVRNALPYVGAIGGALLGGPIGGMAGGALGGSMRGGRHVADRALGGAALGGLAGYGMNSLQSGFGGGAGMLGGGSGIAPGSSLLPSATGWEGAAMAPAASPGLAGGLFGSGGLLNSIVGGGGGMGTALNTGLLATMIGSGLKAKKPKPNPRDNETLQEAEERAMGRGRRGSSADWNKSIRLREAKHPPKEYRGTNWNYFPTPEEQEEQLRRVNEEIYNQMPAEEKRGEQEIPEGYADGGFVEDYYDGVQGGQSDKRLVKVRPKSYIVNSTTVSLAGDGNSKNGAKVIKDWAKSFQNGHFFNEDNTRVMKAYVSDGELKLLPEEVMSIGYGDIDRGVKTIKKMEKNIRKHKGVKRNLLPKSKPLDVYADIRR